MGNSSSKKKENWIWCREWQKTWAGKSSVVLYSEGRKLCALLSHYDFAVSLGLSMHNSLALMWYPRHELKEDDFPKEPPETISVIDPCHFGWFGSLKQFSARFPLDVWHAVAHPGPDDNRLSAVKVFLVSMLIQRQEDAFLTALRIAEKTVLDIMSIRNAANPAGRLGYCQSLHELVISHCTEAMTSKVFLLRPPREVDIGLLFKKAISSGNVPALKLLNEEYSEKRPKDRELVKEAFRSDSKTTLEFMINEIGVVLDSQAVQEGVNSAKCPRCVQFLANYDGSLLEEGRPLLQIACQASSVELVQVCIDAGANINEKGSRRGETALHVATRGSSRFYGLRAGGNTKSNAEIAQLLINKGADVDAVDMSGRTPLHEASDPELVKLLIAAGANVNALAWELKTPLFDASKEKSKLLIKAGCDVKHRSSSGITALFSRSHESKETFDVVLAADPTAITTRSPYSGETVLHMCGRDSRSRFGSFGLHDDKTGSEDPSISRTKLCLKAGMDVNTKNHSGETALIAACKSNNYDLAHYLLTVEEVDVHCRSETGKTALLALCGDGESHFFSRPDNSDLVRLFKRLYKAGANLEDRSDNGSTILHCGSSVPSVLQAIREIQEENFVLPTIEEKNAAQKKLKEFYARVDVSKTEEELHAIIEKYSSAESGFDIMFETLRTKYPEPVAENNEEHNEEKDSSGEEKKENVDSGSHLPSVSSSTTAGGSGPEEKPPQGKSSMDLLVSRLVKSRGEHGRTPLHVAASQICDKSAKALLDLGADPLAIDDEGKTPLQSIASYRLDYHSTSAHGFIDLLAERGASRSELLIHPEMICHAVSKQLVDPGDVTPEVLSKRDEQGRTALHIAFISGDASTVRALLAAGASLLLQDDQGRTPAHIIEAYTEEKNDSLVDIVVEHPSAQQVLQVIDHRGRTPLLRFVSGNMTATAVNINKFVKAGAKVKGVVDENGNNALHLACAKPLSIEAIKLLISLGADVDGKDEYGRTPLFECGQKERELELIKCLISADADPYVVDYFGNTLFHRVRTTFGAQLCLKKKLNINQVNFNNEDPLIVAVNRNDWNLAEFLVRKGANVKRVSRYEKMSALHHAASDSEGSPLVKVLLNAGAIPDALSTIKKTPLHYAMKHDPSITTVKTLARAAPKALSTVSMEGLTPLMQLCKGSEIRNYQLLQLFEEVELAQHVNYNQTCRGKGSYSQRKSWDSDDLDQFEEGLQMFHLALRNAGPDAIDFLEKATKDLLTAGIAGGRTILHVAATGGYPDSLRHILALNEKWKTTPQGGRNFFDVNAIDAKGRNALHYLCISGQLGGEAVEVLAAAGVSATQADSRGITPLHALARRTHPSGCDHIMPLLRAGADVTAKCKRGSTALHHAARAGNLHVMQLLRSKGADVNALDDRGRTAFHWLGAQSETLEHSAAIVEWFISAGADPALKDRDENTPLHCWLATGLPVPSRTLQLFIDAGVSVDAPGLGGRTPLMQGRGWRARFIPNLLEKGAHPSLLDDFGANVLMRRNPDDWSLWERLIEKGASLQVVEEPRGYGLIHQLAINSSTPSRVVLEKIIKLGNLDINQRTTKAGKTSLHLAAEYRRFDMIPRLLALGADKELKDESGRTALDFLKSPKKKNDWGYQMDLGASRHWSHRNGIEAVQGYCLSYWLLDGRRQVFSPIEPKDGEDVVSNDEIDASNPFFKQLFHSIQESVDRAESEREKSRSLKEANRSKIGGQIQKEVLSDDGTEVADPNPNDEEVANLNEDDDGEREEEEEELEDDDNQFVDHMVTGITLKERKEDAKTDPKINTRLDGMLDRYEHFWH